ncbi:Nramp family divalent metal transporter [Algoriphagus sp.]|uniref:Nramp family divalent metal transporter n=1 Tax=Algoriphagus sp. TaxID=1872435 RepID=UPI0026353D05|nr:Nramp family divalent metal transporter [Algoriphagus sp.]
MSKNYPLSIRNLFQNIGPGPIIAAAFIGPGTVMVCTLAGYQFGFSLIWGLLLSILATVVLQETAGRIGLATGKDLAQLLRSQTHSPLLKILQMILVLLAIVLGNTAYESGNITGAQLGLAVFWDSPTLSLGIGQIQSGNFLIGALAFFLLILGNFQVLERVLVGLVILMSMAFLFTAVLVQPDWTAVLNGFVPSLSVEQTTTLVALIGTTVVPYNLFLYASLVKNKWKSPAGIHWMRRDIVLSVLLGGLVSMAILIVGSVNKSEQIHSAQDIAMGLDLVFGSFGRYLMGFGLLAAGLTSSITAPLAAGLVICGIMGWNQQTHSVPMRLSIGLVVGMGLVFASLGIKPAELIALAQLANGLLLPLISGWLIWLANQKIWMKTHKNPAWVTLLSLSILLITIGLGLKSISAVLNLEIF